MEYPRWTGPYFERIRPTFLESWPEKLAHLAVPHAAVLLSPAYVQAIISTAPLWRDRLTAADPSAFHALVSQLQPLLATQPHGGFIRLGSRSPKDAAIFQANRGCVQQAITVIKLLQTSRRAQADLRRCLEWDYTPRLFVRPWLSFQPWQELQCFLRDRRLVGISQLDCVNYGSFPQLREAAPRLESAIREFATRFGSLSHLSKAVFEVLALPQPANPTAFNIYLSDINPWGPPTTARLFDWSRPEDFDGTFRYLR